MSGLMVSLAVVVAAILAVLVLVFSDQPATEQVRRLRGGRGSVSSRRPARATAAGGRPQASIVLRGPPPATVLQRQLALPPTKHRVPLSKAPPPVKLVTPTVAAPVAEPVQTELLDEELIDDELIEEDTGELTIEHDRTFLGRVRSSVALLVLLTLVGGAVALLIGAALFLAELAIQNTVG